MRWLEIRRHSLTKKGEGRGRGSELSSEGIELARRVGATLGPMSCVFTSEVPRTCQTAIAMGYAVDEVLPMPSAYVPGGPQRHEQWTWPRPYVTYAALLRSSPALAEVAARHLEIWHDLMRRVPAGERGLLIGHGGGIELAVVAAVGALDLAEVDSPLSHCDGFTLAYHGGCFTEAQQCRAPALGPGSGSERCA